MAMETPDKLTPADQQFLLELSRKFLAYYFEHGEDHIPAPGEIPEKLKVRAATFVTLTINGELRGCIGRLEAEQELYLDVIENTALAAFSDSRFPQLSEKEFAKVKIEISILTQPQPLDYSGPESLLAILDKDKPGLIIKSGHHQATFLPQVWEELPEAADFLSQLCRKAGLKGNFWKEQPLEIRSYRVVHFQE